MKEFIAKLFFSKRRLWTVVYPDGKCRTCCTLAVAKDYKELFGGTIKFLGKFNNIRKDHFA